MLQTPKAYLMGAFPKSGQFYAISHDVDTAAATVGGSMKAVVPYTHQQYVWSDGKLYQEVEPCFGAMHWEETTVEDEVDYLHEESKAVCFCVVPNSRRVF